MGASALMSSSNVLIIMSQPTFENRSMLWSSSRPWNCARFARVTMQFSLTFLWWQRTLWWVFAHGLYMLRAIPPVHCAASLARQNGFSWVFLHRMLRLAKAQQSLTPAVDWLDGLIGWCGLLVVVSHVSQSQFQFYGWGWEKVNN